MLQGRNRRIALNTVMAQLATAAVAIVGMDMQPHRVWGMSWCPALWAKLQRPGLLDRNAFNDSI